MSAARCSSGWPPRRWRCAGALWYLAILALLILGRWQAREFIYMQF